jgi:hypothetical protein
VERHLEDGDVGSLRKRVNATVAGLKDLAKRLSRLCCERTVAFLRLVSNYVVTFARLAVEGRRVPWNSNIIDLTSKET